MRREHENPISLFSFQDIVTSLTGIMIIVILVIVLQLVETVSESAHKIAPDAEYLACLTEIEQMKAEKESLLEQTVQLSPETKELLLLSTFELNNLLIKENNLLTLQQPEQQLLQHKNELLTEQLADLNQDIEQNQEQLRQARKEAEELKASLQIIEKLEEDATKLLTRIEERQRAQNALQLKITERPRKLVFSFIGHMERIPLLVECSQEGFRAQCYGQSQVHDFRSQSEHLNMRNLQKWLKTYDLKKHYPVLLFREDTFKKHAYIENQILELSSNLLLGREPIGMDWEVF